MSRGPEPEAVFLLRGFDSSVQVFREQAPEMGREGPEKGGGGLSRYDRAGLREEA